MSKLFSGRSYIDLISVLRQILNAHEQAAEWINLNLYVLFIDFEKAFESLHRATPMDDS